MTPVAWIDNGKVIIEASALVGLLGGTVAAPVEWYDSQSYPHGPKAFRRHVRAGMKAVRVGRGYRVRVEDAEAFWTTLRTLKKGKSRKVETPATASSPVAQLARAGIKVRQDMISGVPLRKAGA